MYLDLSEEDRLRSELELIFAKPELTNETKALYSLVADLGSCQNRLQMVRYGRVVSAAAAVTSALLLLPEWMFSGAESVGIGRAHWLLLLLMIEAVVAFVSLSVYYTRTKNRIVSAVHERLEMSDVRV